MRVLQILNCTFPDQVGGAEASARELREGLRSRGFKVTVLSLSTPQTSHVLPEGELRITLPNIYDPWRDVARKNVLQKIVWKAIDFFNPVALFKVAAIVREGRYDVVLTHNLKGFSTAVWMAAKYAGASRVVHVIHDYYLVCTTCALGVPGVKKCEKQCGACKAYTLPNRWLSSYVDSFVGVSQFVADRHAECLRVPKERFSVINNVRKSLSKEISLAKVDDGRLFLERKVLRIGFIGRLEDAKGIKVFLEAMSVCSDRFEIVVAGKEVEEGYKDALVRKYPKLDVKWLGQVSPKDFYDRIDIVVVPSVWDEPFPAVAYEPQIFGKVVVASKVGGIPEIVVDGETGFLYQHDRPEELAEVLTDIAADRLKAKRVADTARERSCRFVDAEAMLDAYKVVLGGVELNVISERPER